MLRCLSGTKRAELDRRWRRAWGKIVFAAALGSLALAQAAAAAEARTYRVLHVCACVPAVAAEERDELVEAFAKAGYV